jgi:hypothetical protein
MPIQPGTSSRRKCEASFKKQGYIRNDRQLGLDIKTPKQFDESVYMNAPTERKKPLSVHRNPNMSYQCLCSNNSQVKAPITFEERMVKGVKNS